MQIQTPIIQIYGSYRCNLIVADKTFRVDKSRFILINLYAALHQLFVIRLRQQKHQFFIRYLRRYNSDVDAAFCSVLQRNRHFIVHDQIRRININILLRMVDNIQINIFSHIFMIQRRITVRLHKTVFRIFRLMVLFRQVLTVIFGSLPDIIPHFQKHRRKTPYRFAFNLYAGIFPVTEPLFFVDVFICNIDPAGKSHLPVYHQNLSMIPVVQYNRQNRTKRVKRRGFYTHGF